MTPAITAPTSVRFSEARMQPLASLGTTSSHQVIGTTRFASVSKETTRKIGASQAGTASVELQLFNATAAIKVWTSQVAMHLDRGTRDRLFAQIDALHDHDEWSDGDSKISLASYQTMIRAMIHHRMNSKPALSIMPSGNVIALWTREAGRLTVEFLPGNRVRWLVAMQSKQGPERAAGESPIERLSDVLRPYDADGWLDGC